MLVNPAPDGAKQMSAVHFIENMDRTSVTITDEEFEKNVEAAVSAIAEKHGTISPITSHQATFNEKTGLQAAGVLDRPYVEDDPRRSTSSSVEGDGENPAIGGLLKTIQRPWTTIGRMFSDEAGPSTSNADGSTMPPGQPARPEEGGSQRPSLRHTLSVEEAAARQASAEAAEAQRLHRAEHANVVETLAGMFPDLDKEVISDVVYQKEGR